MISPTKFHPVVLGGDIGAYAVIRCFHEAYGVRATLLSRRRLGPVADSKILDLVIAKDYPESGESTLPPMVQNLVDLAPKLQARYPDTPLVLMANIDTFVREIVENREVLEQYYRFAFPDAQIIEDTNDKSVFPRLAEKYGMVVPPTLSLNLGQGVAAARTVLEEWGHSGPLIIKPATSYGYELLELPGKAKVYRVEDVDAAVALLGDLYEHTREYPQARHFVVQPLITGNDSYNLSITAYVDRRGQVTMLGSAHVLLEDHTPTGLGNPVAMVTEPYPGLYRQVVRFLQGLGWHGFANFDLKVDRASGRPYVFEVNPRIGRNCYYNAAAGLNPMRFLVADLVEDAEVEPERVDRRVLYSLVPAGLLGRYVDGEMRARLRALRRRGQVANPLWYPVEFGMSRRGLRRLFYVLAARVNHWRKFARWYPLSAHREKGTETYDTAGLCS